MAAARRKHRGADIVINPERKAHYDEHAQLFAQHVDAKRPARSSWWTANAAPDQREEFMADARGRQFHGGRMAAFRDLGDEIPRG